MTSSARAVLRVVLIFVGLSGLVYISLFFVVSSAKFRTWVTTKLSEASGAEVRAASIHLLPPMILKAEGFEISKPGEFLLQSRRLTATITPLDLFSKTLHRLKFDEPVLEVDVQGLHRSPNAASGQIALRNLNVQGGTIVLKKGERVIFKIPKINLNAQNFNFGGQAGMKLYADVPQLDGAMELTLAGRLSDLEAEIAVRPKRPDGATPDILHLRAKIHPLERQTIELTLAAQFQKLGMDDAKFSGALDWRAVLDRELTATEFTGQLKLYSLPPVLLPAALKFPDGPSAADFSGRFAFAEKRLTLKLQRLASPMGSGVGEGEIVFLSQPEISKATLTWRDVPLEFLQALLPAPLNRWTYAGRAQLNGKFSGAWNALHVEGVARGDQIQVRGENTKAADVKFTVPFAWSSRGSRISGAMLDVNGLDYTDKNRWHLAAARARATASSELEAGQPLKIRGRFETAAAKFNSPDNTQIGENFSLSGDYDITSRDSGDALAISSNVNVDTGELLWGKFFGDLGARKPGAAFDAVYFRKADRLECRRCNISLNDIGAVEMSGSIDRVSAVPELRLEAHSANFSPGGFFNFFLRDTYNRQYPLLDQLALAGVVTFQTRLTGAVRELAAEGELALKTGEIRVKSWNWQLGPLALNLPFQIHLADSGSLSASAPRTGTLVLEGGRFGGQSIGPTKTTLSLENNALRFHEPIRLALFGGAISLTNLSWPEVIHHPKQLSFSFECKRVELETLSQALNWPRFGGTLTGSIPEVRSIGDMLQSNGEIQADLFGGRITMNKLEVENPFSSIASIKLNAALAGIQLERLSQTFAFGRISGILEGTIEDLVVTAGQPAQFRADLHSVDRGTEQRISVEALNKITVLSSGQNAGALYGGLAGFFDSFRYSKLGFRAVLLNDQLTLRGVETRGDAEYLVVGSFLPPTVNVVSHTQNIAFSELLRRLQRINSNKPEVK